jgi:hypothetical protein
MKEENRMPTGPKSKRRPADAVGAPIKAEKIVIGEVGKMPNLKSGRRRYRKVGGAALVRSASPVQRKKTATQAALVRWSEK